MKRWAVSYIDLYDFELSTSIVEASNWKEALHKHPKINGEYNYETDDIEQCKSKAFDEDFMFEVVEIV